MKSYGIELPNEMLENCKQEIYIDKNLARRIAEAKATFFWLFIVLIISQIN